MVCAYGLVSFTHAVTSVGESSYTIFPLKSLLFFQGHFEILHCSQNLTFLLTQQNVFTFPSESL